MDVILLLDRSGSSQPVTQDQINLVDELESRAGERKVAVYGYSSTGMIEALLTPLKTFDGSFDVEALQNIPAGGSPTGDAIAKIGKLHKPARLIVVTDGASFEPEAVAPAIAELAGWEVYGLHLDYRRPDPRIQADLDQQFGNNWAELADGSDYLAGLDAALNAAIEPRLAPLDEPALPATAPASSDLSLDAR